MSLILEIVLSFLIGFAIYSVLSILKTAAQLLIGLAFKCEFMQITLLCFTIVKENGRLTFKMKNTGMFIMLKMITGGMSKIKAFTFQCLPSAFCFIALVCAAFVFYGFRGLGGISLSVSIILVIYSLFEGADLLKKLDVVLGSSPRAVVAAFNIEIMNKVNEGIRPLNFEMKDFEPYTEKPDNIYLMYLYIKFCYLLENQKYEELKPIITVFEKYRPEMFNETFTPQSYAILFYYTFVETNPERAKKAFRYTEKMLLSDNDANGLRVYAFYLYYIEGNKAKAFELASRGMDIWQHMPDKGMGYMEHDLLEYLLRVMYEETGMNISE